MRQLLLATSVLGVVLVLALQSCSGTQRLQPADEAHSVHTSSGIVRPLLATDDTLLWADIPYAEAPVGALRWRAPRALNTPDIDRTPSAHPIGCPQLPSTSAPGLGEDPVVGREDCLYLDVRAPAVRSDRLPVMVWIHGGGNTTGYKGAYDFSRLVAREQVIVVSVNYRLGPLGWLTHPAIQTGRDGLDRTSNFGTLDIIAALEWVQKNIARFGGDAGRVTVFGESAGGHNVFALLSSPLANGLFQRAISQSGYVSYATVTGAHNPGGENREITRSSSALATAVGIREDADDQTVAASWYATPAADLVAAWEALPDTGFEALTTADGVVIPERGILEGLRNRDPAAAVPVIAGANRDEVTLWLATSRYFVDVSYPLTRIGPPRLQVRDPALYSFWVNVRSRAWKLRGVDDPLHALAESGHSELYAYRFAWDDQAASWFAHFPTLIGAAHGVEISFLTGAWYYGPITSWVYPQSPQRDALSAHMMHGWAEFAREGQPPDALDWTPWTVQQRAYLELDSEIRMDLETADLHTLLGSVAQSDLLNKTERCTLVWDSLVNIGEPDYRYFRSWNNGFCSDIDIQHEKRSIRAQLEAEYGSASTL